MGPLFGSAGRRAGEDPGLEGVGDGRREDDDPHDAQQALAAQAVGLDEVIDGRNGAPEREPGAGKDIERMMVIETYLKAHEERRPK